MPPGGLPEAFLEGGRRAAARARARASRAGAGRSRPPRRTSASAASVEPVLHELEREERLVRGELRPGGTEREWCDPDVLRRLRRASLAALRREVEPAEQAALGRFLPALARDRPARDAARGARAAAGAAAAGRRSGSPRCCRAACPATSPRSSTSSARPARSSGSAPGSTASRVYFREDAPVLGRAGGGAAARGRGARRDPRGARARAPSSGSTCSPRPGSRPRRRCPRSGSSSGRAR